MGDEWEIGNRFSIDFLSASAALEALKSAMEGP